MCALGRVHHMTAKEDQSRRGVRKETGGGGEGAVAIATPPPSVQTSKEGGRTSNPNRQRSSGSLLKRYTQRRRRAREGRVGRPRPSGDAPAAPRPPQAHPRPPPASARGVARARVPENSAASAGPAPGGEKGVCVRPAGARTSPPSSRRPCPPAPLRSGADPPGRFLPPDRVDGGRRGAPRSFGERASERFPRGLGKRVRTNSSPGARELRRGRSADCAGEEPPDKRRAPEPPRRRRSHLARPLN